MRAHIGGICLESDILVWSVWFIIFTYTHVRRCVKYFHTNVASNTIDQYNFYALTGAMVYIQLSLANTHKHKHIHMHPYVGLQMHSQNSLLRTLVRKTMRVFYHSSELRSRSNIHISFFAEYECFVKSVIAIGIALTKLYCAGFIN